MPRHLHQRLYANLLACRHHPIGRGPGTVTPEDTAFAITAEVVSVRRGGTGRSLTRTDTSVPKAAPVPAAPGSPSVPISLPSR
ncbi:hypothetical protein [Streptomyces atratus]|uniref:hypothetical protein n=1 Tax=Streptomyces atratus TaxID=1893 RepID=UPI002256A159|nr:hypothetical protein [Streptomyces atratus]MCX5345445.1 hypothetical protein [Streptomyces atratus]